MGRSSHLGSQYHLAEQLPVTYVIQTTEKTKATTNSGLKSLFYNGAAGRSRTGTL